MMRVNRSTLARLCLLTALAVPVQRSAFATVAQGNPGSDVNQQLIAQDANGTASGPAVTSPDGELTATINEDNLVVLENADGEVVAGPLVETGGTVTALAFSDDGQILATGSETGQVGYWDISGEPIGGLFQPVIGDDNAITELRFEDAQTLFVGATQGRQGLWGLDGLPPGESLDAESAVGENVDEAVGEDVGGAIAAADTAGVDADASPWWIWLLPLLGILGLGWLFLSRRNSQTNTAEAQRQTSPTATVPPPTSDPETDREVSSRAQTVISTDRVTDESRVVDESRAVEADTLAEVPTASSNTGLSGTAPSRTNLSRAEAFEGETSSLRESTDLESPNLEGTNLDLAAASMALGDVALGDVTTSGNETVGSSDTAAATESDDPWDDAFDDTFELTLDDEPDEVSSTENEEPSMPSAEAILTRSLEQSPAESPAVETPAMQTPAAEIPVAKTPTVETSDEALAAPAIETPPATEVPAAEESPEVLAAVVLETPASDIDTIEPTRDMVIAETETILDIEPNRETIIGDSAVIFSGVAAAGAATTAVEVSTDTEAEVSPPIAAMATSESTTLISSSETSPLTIEDLASTDDGLAELPEGYGESRIVLLPRDPEWAYAYWDVSNEHKEQLRQQGGQRLMLRLYDVTDLDFPAQSPHSMRQVDCHEMARSWYLEVLVSDRDYIAEIGYLTDSDRWLLLARSAPIRVPPIYPSDWVKDQFVTIDWQERLAGRTFSDLGQPYSPGAAATTTEGEATDLPKVYDNLFALTQSQEALRVAGSLYGSMQQTAPGALSPSGGVARLERLPGPAGLNVSGLNVSGLTMSGIGSGGSELPGRSRKFWLVADAELIVYGATEPDATLTIGDKVVPLNPDGTFRFHVSFPDGQIDYPIRAVAADGEQTRSVRLNFERQTPERSTNTKDEAKDEWF